MAKPKVISLLQTDKMNNRFLSVSMLGRPTDVFLQCSSYDLKLPVNARQPRILDIFEETVLRMMKLKKCNVSELADVLCLEKDLVKFIIIRLQEKGLLKDEYTLSNVGERQLVFQESIREEVEYQTAKLFVVKDCEVILPYIYVGNFVSEDVVEFSPSGITLGFGSIGDQKKVTGSCIRESKGKTRRSASEQVETENKIRNELKNAVKKFNRLAEKRGKEKIILAEDYGIESTRGEDVYFHMQMAVQGGNTEELLVSDGFVSNVDGLFAYIRKVDPDLVMRIQSKAVQMDMEERAAGEKTPGTFRGKYPEVWRYCLEMEKYVHRISEESFLDDIRQTEEEKRQAVINCYSMLEWAFYYYSLKNPMSDTLLQVCKRQKSYENSEMIRSLAEKIGLRNLDDCSVLFSGFDGRSVEMIYKAADRTTPNMKVVLPISIIEASENDDSELRSLIAKDCRFLPFINDVGRRAANFRHDSTAEAKDIKIEEIRNHAVDIVTSILPDIQLRIDDVRVAQHVSNERLKASVACEKVLGSLLYTSLEEGTKADFRIISPDKTPALLPPPYEYVQVLYRILQTAFYEENKRYLTKRGMSKEECIGKNEELLGKKLPKSLVTVKTERYNAAQRGIKSTLGAHFLSLVPNLLKKDLELLKKQDIVETIDKILEYRKHANDISLMVSDEELSDLRARTINIIKILGGYYDD